MKIFIICSVRNATDTDRLKLETYVSKLEADGHQVHLPHRDTNQAQSGFEICRANAQAIVNSDEVHVFYTAESQGTHFDLGAAFALGRRLVVVENIPYGVGKSFPRMIDEWSQA